MEEVQTYMKKVGTRQTEVQFSEHPENIEMIEQLLKQRTVTSNFIRFQKKSLLQTLLILSKLSPVQTLISEKTI